MSQTISLHFKHLYPRLSCSDSHHLVSLSWSTLRFVPSGFHWNSCCVMLFSSLLRMCSIYFHLKMHLLLYEIFWLARDRSFQSIESQIFIPLKNLHEELYVLFEPSNVVNEQTCSEEILPEVQICWSLKSYTMTEKIKFSLLTQSIGWPWSSYHSCYAAYFEDLWCYS